MTEMPAAAARTHPCPVCDQPVPLGMQRCPNPACQVDLSELAAFDTLAPGLYRAALAQVERGELEAALKTLDAAQRFDPGHIDARVVQGKLLARQGRYEQAAACWEEALRLCPGEPRALAGIEQVRRKQAAARAVPRKKGVHRYTIFRIGIAILAGLLLGYLLFYYTAAPESRSFDQTIHANPALAGLGLTVQEDAANLRLSGTLPNETYRQWVEELARSSAPGKTLDARGLRVETPPDPAAAVKTALADDARTRKLTVQVEPRAGGVAILGSVPDEQSLTALRTVAGATGLAVDTSGLAVEMPKLAAAVQQRLAAEKLLEGEKITVAQEGSGIRLSGEVASQPARDLAGQAAGQAPGVAWVDASELRVRGDLAFLVKSALMADVNLSAADIRVEQAGSGVKLTGKVERPEQVEIAGEIARVQHGVELVDLSGLEVAWQGQTYTVQTGDTLTGIAQKMYGQWWMWSVIVQANPDSIKDPRRVPIGTVLLIPRMIPALDRGPYR